MSDELLVFIHYLLALFIHSSLLWLQVPSSPSRSSLAGDVGTEGPTPASDADAAPKAGPLDILWGIQICLPVDWNL